MEEHKKFRIKEFKIIADFVIDIHFIDGKTQTINFNEVQLKGWWEELRDLAYFNQARISEVKHLEWPHGQDYNPEYLYYWEKYKKYFQKEI